MWIKIKQTFNVDHYQFFKDEVRDITGLPADIKKRMPKKYYQEIASPWEASVDEDQRKIDIARQRFLHLQSQANAATDLARTAEAQARKDQDFRDRLKKNPVTQKTLAAGHQAQKTLEDKSAGPQARANAELRIRDMEITHLKLQHAEHAYQASASMMLLQERFAAEARDVANAAKTSLDELVASLKPEPEPETDELKNQEKAEPETGAAEPAAQDAADTQG